MIVPYHTVLISCTLWYELLLYRRRTQSAWPIFVSLAVHSNAARNSKWGKALVGLIDPPKRDEGQADDAYSLCMSMFYLKLYGQVMKLINNWGGGFHLTLPGDVRHSTVVPRIGLFLADLVEARMLVGSQQNWSVRCVTKVTHSAPGTVVECPEPHPGRVVGGDVRLDWKGALERVPKLSEVRNGTACTIWYC